MYYYINEINTHNSINDCWLIVKNKVYDVTRMINTHPGSQNAILRKCGTDVTYDYNFHSNNTRKKIWEIYHIGYVKNNYNNDTCCNIM
jgi:cytochrome b involved in lipid metabolism